jgi:predicted nucleic acid-binding protein
MALYLADTSAWNRSNTNPAVAERWWELMRGGELAMCPPVFLELLYSARSPADYASLRDELSGLPLLPLSERAVQRAFELQAALAARSQHRGPTPTDLLVAAVAEVGEAILLHYDRHFDQVASVTHQPMEWLARRGTIP